jgi:anthranilate synthase component 1
MEVGDRSPEVLREAYDDAVARIKTIKVRLASPLVFPEPNLSAKCVAPKGNKSRHEFEEMVRKAKELIRAGDILQVVLSRRVERGTMAHPLAIYRSLRCLNPSPWMFYIQFGRMWRQDGDGSSPPPLHLIGASPELHASFEVASRKATVTPIAGTRRRGKTEEEDNQLAEELLQDPKERAEHAMLVDLGRNDIGRIAKYGSVEEREKFTIEKYSHVMHIVSRVTGEVREGLDAFDVLRATFPAGTLSGAPKIRAMEIIEDLEGERRGPYGGCAGYFSFSGDMGTCITIRTIVQKGSRCYIQAGAGIVADSDPSREYEETVNKGLALMQTIDEVEQEM